MSQEGEEGDERKEEDEGQGGIGIRETRNEEGRGAEQNRDQGEAVSCECDLRGGTGRTSPGIVVESPFSARMR